MIRRHFFLIAALFVIIVMAGAGVYKLVSTPKAGPGGAPAGAAGGGRGGAPGGGAPGGAAPGGGRGGAGGPGGGGGGGRGGGRGGPVVAAATIQPHNFADRLEVLGVAKGRQSVTLTAVGAQLVQAVRFRPGDHVQRNQVLIELNRTQEDAGIVQAQSDLDLAKRNADRWTTLATQGVASQSEAETYQAAYDHAKAALDLAKSKGDDRVIRAPFAGVVGLSDIAPGALISPGTAIATIDDMTVMTVDFDVPDRFLSLLHEGGGISATTDAFPGEQYSGRIAKIDTRIDERTRTIKARAEFPNPKERLKPGMLMRVGVDRGMRTSPAAPEAAVQFTGGQAYVFYIAQRNGGTFAEQRYITPGDVTDGLVEVRDGLQVCDQVVADGLNRVQPNQQISIGGRGGGGGGRGGPGGGRGGPGGPGAAQGGAAGAAPGDRGGSGPGGGNRGAGQAGGRSGGDGGSRAGGRGGQGGGEGGAGRGAGGRGGGGRGGPGGGGGRGGAGAGGPAQAPMVACPGGGGRGGLGAGAGAGLGGRGGGQGGGQQPGGPAGASPQGVPGGGGRGGGRGGRPGGAPAQ